MVLKTGMKIIKSKVFDKELVHKFAEITGDFNPIHFDEEFAKNTIFKKPIVHGPLIVIMITTLFATDLPGPGSVYLSHDLKFIKPVYHGEEITFELEIVNINEKNIFL